MVNSEGFSKRLKEIFEFYELSASSFADRIDVGRASISHILSGRNKPSLDFVMRVVSTFKEVELYWLLNGKGQFPFSPENDHKEAEDKIEVTEDSQVVNSEKDMNNIAEGTQPSRTEKQIKKVIIFYDDGSFESYENYPKK